MDWIKTSDKLPEKDGEYIVSEVADNGDVFVRRLGFTVEGFMDYFDNEIKPNTFYDTFENYYEGYCEYVYVPCQPIAWMSCPEPYNPEEEEL